MIDLADIRAAALAIAPAAIVTPVLRSDDLDDLTGASLFAKDESQQRAGAFKFRGAYNAAEYLAPRRSMLQDWADFLDLQRGELGNLAVLRAA